MASCCCFNAHLNGKEKSLFSYELSLCKHLYFFATCCHINSIKNPVYFSGSPIAKVSISSLANTLFILWVLIMVSDYPNYIFNTMVFDTSLIASLYTNPIVINNPLLEVFKRFLLVLCLKPANLGHDKIYICRLSHTYLEDNICMVFCSL